MFKDAASRLMIYALIVALLAQGCAAPVTVYNRVSRNLLTDDQVDISRMKTYTLMRTEALEDQLLMNPSYDELENIMNLHGYRMAGSNEIPDMLVSLTWTYEQRIRLEQPSPPPDHEHEKKHHHHDDDDEDNGNGSAIVAVLGIIFLVGIIALIASSSDSQSSDDNAEVEEEFLPDIYYEHTYKVSFFSDDLEKQYLSYTANKSSAMNDPSHVYKALLARLNGDLPMREGYTPEINLLQQDEDGLKYALKYVYPQQYVIPSTGWIAKYPSAGTQGTQTFDAGIPVKHYRSLKIDDRYAPLLSDILVRNWPMTRTPASGKPKTLRIEGHYLADGQPIDVVMELKREGSKFVPKNLQVTSSVSE